MERGLELLQASPVGIGQGAGLCFEGGKLGWNLLTLLVQDPLGEAAGSATQAPHLLRNSTLSFRAQLVHLSRTLSSDSPRACCSHPFPLSASYGSSTQLIPVNIFTYSTVIM